MRYTLTKNTFIHQFYFMRSLSKLCVLLLAAGLLIAPASGAAASKSKKKKSKTEEVAKPKVDKYTKMFVNDKSCLTAKGPFLTLHKLKGKLYVEVPLKTIGREMLIASTISEASDTNLGTIGYKPTDPIHVKFTRIDTTIYLSQAVVPPVHDTNDPHMSKAIGRSTLPPIMHSYPLVCYNRDSSAMVIEMTKFFSGDNELLAPIKSTKGGVVNITGKFKSEGSVINQIKSFEDNVTVKSYLSYSVTADLLGLLVIKKDEPMTVKVTRTILLLPEEAMRPRLADSRIGIFLTGMSRINGKKDKIEDFSVINRWNIQPKDMEAWKRGELVEPVKPIVFYLDDAFPALWREPIRRGVLRWNKAFEKIGFKNVMHIEDFPKDDPEFDPDNIKYSCIRYAPIAIANAMGPSWVDPRSGEILNASVYVYHDVMKLLNNWLFVQTAQADERVRAVTIPEEVIGDGLRYVVAHEVGHCLGYMHNMSASAVIPVDSLRSPSFTQKYGTTTSIMDYARFNYVARPGDRERGVKLTPPRFGLYDYYAVKWLYTPVPDAATAADEYAVTSKWITGAAADSVYRFGKQQFSRSIDPRSQSEDLGDDAVKASGYGIANLKYILGNMNAWIGAQDPDFSQRRTLYDEVLTQYIRYLNHVLANVGGIYFAEKMEGDPVEAYRSVPRERQREALLFCLAQLKDMKWLDNAELIRDMPLMGSPAESIMASLVSVVVAAPARVALSAALAEKEAYTPEECRRDVYEFVWASTLKGRTPDALEMMLQREYVRSLSLSAGLKYTGTGAREEKKLVSDEGLMPVPAFLGEHAARTAALTACGERCGHDPFETFSAAHRVDTAPLLGYGSPRLNYYDPRNTEAGDYAALLKLRAMLRTKSASATGEARLHYELLLRNIEKALKK